MIPGAGMGNTDERDALRRRIMRRLRQQGFSVRANRIVAPACCDKAATRALHSRAVEARVARARGGLERYEQELLRAFASGAEVEAEAIRPRLVEVWPETHDELLFRYARLHWSIPVSAGYGRRLRFVIYDESNGKLIGIFGLGDPVYSLGPRDQWIGWSWEAKRARLRCVMDVFVLGALPPYSQLLCGKLVALLTTSAEVQRAFRRRYAQRVALISGRPLDARLALLTTTSALGRSSIYNRLRFRGEEVFVSAGFTQGSGDFHFSDGFYEDLRRFALRHCDPTAKHTKWGQGFRNRREVIRKALPLLGLSRELVYHGVRREIFVIPLAQNAATFLRGECHALRPHRRTVDELFSWFRERWLLPRAARDDRYRSFDPESCRIWDTG
jgi:hypothetical protein